MCLGVQEITSVPAYCEPKIVFKQVDLKVSPVLNESQDANRQEKITL